MQKLRSPMVRKGKNAKMNTVFLNSLPRFQTLRKVMFYSSSNVYFLLCPFCSVLLATCIFDGIRGMGAAE